MKKTTILLLLLIGGQIYAHNDTAPLSANTYISLEVDPAPFVLGGYSFSLKYSPASASHFAFMASVYSSPFPDKMMSKANYDKGFRDQKLETSYALFADYFRRPDRKGLHFGPALFYYSRSTGMDLTTQRTNFNSIYPNLRIGYVYKPFKKAGFYVDPWFNLGKEFILDKNNRIGNSEYKVSDIYYILAIHFGYQVVF